MLFEVISAFHLAFSVASVTNFTMQMTQNAARLNMTRGTIM